METRIKPVLSVRNGLAAVEFYKTAFGAEEILKLTSPDGSVFAELSIEGASFFVADESPSNGNFSPESVPGNTVRMALMLTDPDFIFTKALNAGAREVYPVCDQDYGYRLGRLIDPYGHHWEIGRPINL